MAIETEYDSEASSEINEDFLSSIKHLSRIGLSIEQVADCQGINIDSFMERRHEFPEIDKALKEGRVHGIFQVATALFESAINGNTDAQIFYLEHCAHWNVQNKTNSSNY